MPSHDRNVVSALLAGVSYDKKALTSIPSSSQGVGRYPTLFTFMTKFDKVMTKL